MNETAIVSAPAVGVDVGGTFTDLVVADARGVWVAKVPSTPGDQAEGILAGLDRLTADGGISDIASLTRFAHGTTVATNTVLERDGARVVLVTTAGVGDLLEIARQERPRLYDLAGRRPPAIVPRDLVVEVAERTDAAGCEVVVLTDTEVARVVAAVAERRPDAVAISLLFGFLAPRNEERLAEALETLGVPVSRASALLPVFREVERTSTVALNAYVAPRMDRYLASLRRQLRDRGLRVAVEVMRSGGGTFDAATARREPVHTLLSGPAAGAWGAAALGSVVGDSELIALDVGGTSTDVTLVEGGRPATTATGTIGGLPFAVTSTDIHTIGAGGGSLAWRDVGGALRVGPRSAGAVPGPACYGTGGRDATVTDADVVLGRLDADARLGGALPLRADLAAAAVGRLAAELGLEPRATAEGIVRVADARMVAALRVVSVERGRDPRAFSLVAFGGAGPLHQAALAAALGIRRVLVPPNPGVLSALGLLATPPTIDRARSLVRALAEIDDPTLRREWARLESEATGALRSQGVEVAAVRRTADVRYRGQAFELEVEGPSRDDPDASVAIADAFHGAHLTRFGYHQPDEAIELVTLRVRAEGPGGALPLPRWTRGGSRQDAVLARRAVVADEGPVETTIFDRPRLAAGVAFRGPAVLLGPDATVWVAPWQRGGVDDHGVVILEDAAAP